MYVVGSQQVPSWIPTGTVWIPTKVGPTSHLGDMYRAKRLVGPTLVGIQQVRFGFQHGPFRGLDMYISGA